MQLLSDQQVAADRPTANDPRPRARSAARRLNTYLDAQTGWLDDNPVISLR
jgi:hypothetical protein